LVAVKNIEISKAIFYDIMQNSQRRITPPSPASKGSSETVDSPPSPLTDDWSRKVETCRAKWISFLYDGREIDFTHQDGSTETWRLEEKLSEHNNYESEPPEARAVYYCRQTAGYEVGREAVLKMFMQ
jgi:hypothetical protein